MRILIFAGRQPTEAGRANARFLRGVAGELVARGHEALLWRASARCEDVLDRADVALVHDLTEPETVQRIREHHAGSGRYLLLFYDTHQRAGSAPPELRRFNLAGFDGVLAATGEIRQTYAERGWSDRAWIWHEAADAAAFAPHPGAMRSSDLAWIGDRHDLGAGQELGTLVLEPARRLGLTGVIHGDHYPWRARLAIQRSGLRYGGPLAEHLVPAVWARHRFTVALPRRRHPLSGFPPARLFEALASGIPVISTPWEDSEGLLAAGRDYLVARDQREMEAAMRALRNDRAMAAELAEQGRATILARHTCADRADRLLAIVGPLRPATADVRRQMPATESARIHAFSRKLGEKSPDPHYGFGQQVGAR